jgi:hypothetical protein
MNRYKRQGWFNESYRHYLAAKGVSTNAPRRYFVQTAFGRAVEGGFKEVGKVRSERDKALLSPLQPARRAVQSELLKRRIATPLTSAEESARRERVKSLERVVQPPLTAATRYKGWQPSYTVEISQRLLNERKELESKLRSLSLQDAKSAAEESRIATREQSLQSAIKELDDKVIQRAQLLKKVSELKPYSRERVDEFLLNNPEYKKLALEDVEKARKLRLAGTKG